MCVKWCAMYDFVIRYLLCVPCPGFIVLSFEMVEQRRKRKKKWKESTDKVSSDFCFLLSFWVFCNALFLCAGRDKRPRREIIHCNDNIWWVMIFLFFFGFFFFGNEQHRILNIDVCRSLYFIVVRHFFFVHSLFVVRHSSLRLSLSSSVVFYCPFVLPSIIRNESKAKEK